ncbi:MAG: hypothetical protein KC910_14035 [Candidatus Eremiobacteraeota bacterium]|nr:hypothetical protein [Candidatus Eremiobacteraeota bacterium]
MEKSDCILLLCRAFGLDEETAERVFKRFDENTPKRGYRGLQHVMESLLLHVYEETRGSVPASIELAS